MDKVKIVAGFAYGFLIFLFYLVIFVENSEQRLYDETVEILMIQHKLSSTQEVLDLFPKLKDIKSKIKRINTLKNSINSITGGPSPNVSKEESLQVQDYIEEIYLLQQNIKEELSQLNQAIYTNYIEVPVSAIKVK